LDVDLVGVKTDLQVQYWEDWEKFTVAKIEFRRSKEIYEKYLPFAGVRWDEKTQMTANNENRKAEGQVVSDPQMIEAIKVMQMAEQTYKAAKARYDKVAEIAKSVGTVTTSIPDPPKTDVQALLEPVQKEMEAKLAEVQEIEEQKEFLIVRAPFDGVITTVFVRPDQAVQPGTPICTLAATKTEYVLAYVRQNSTLRPRVGMKAEVRFRGSNETIPGAIVRVGAHVEAVSLKQLFDPQLQEWGLPIAIQLKWPNEKQMHDLEPRPGEIVFVRVLPNEKDDSAIAGASDVNLQGASIVFAGNSK
jgi:multidrug resistance efflux pump